MKNGDRFARNLLFELKQRESARKLTKRFKSRAASGELHDVFQYYLSARVAGDSLELDQATKLFAAQPSATARSFYNNWVSNELDPLSKESLLLHAQVALENWTRPGMTEAFRERHAEQNEIALQRIVSEAERGNENAIWVIRQLREEGIELK